MSWQNFLAQQGGEFINNKLINFGAVAKELHLINTGTVIGALTQFTILKISGDDAYDFLQNQLSNDVNKLSNNNAQYTSWCTHQGKVIATLLLIKHYDSFYVLVAEDLKNTLIQRFQMFILRSKVTVSLEHNLMAMEIYGNQVRQYLPELPTAINQQIIVDETIIIRVLGAKPRGFIIANKQALISFWHRLDVDCAPIGSSAQTLINIQSGVAHISADNSEMFVPHALNMTKIPMIDFKKGCYPGQEVVARMQYLGNNKHSMYHICIDRNTKLKPGDRLSSIQSHSSKRAGTIVQTALNADGLMVGLAVLENTLIETQILDIDNNQVSIAPIIY